MVMEGLRDSSRSDVSIRLRESSVSPAQMFSPDRKAMMSSSEDERESSISSVTPPCQSRAGTEKVCT